MTFYKIRKYASSARAYMALGTLAFSLSACGFIWGEGALGPADPHNYRQPGQSSHIQAKPLNEADTATQSNGVTIRHKTLKTDQPTTNNMNASTAPTDITTKPSGTPSLISESSPSLVAPSMAQSAQPTAPLIAMPNASNDQRITKLEQAVQKLQNDLSRIQPALARLAGLETDLRALVNSLQSINETAAPLRQENAQADAPAPTPQTTTPNTPPVVTTPKMRPILDEASKTTTKANNTDKAIIRDIRSGQYDNKMRLVFDISGDADFTYSLDKNENILTVIFEDVSVGQQFNIYDARGGIVSAASMTSNGKDQIASFALNRKSDVLLATTLSPNQDSPYTRVIIDMEK